MVSIVSGSVIDPGKTELLYRILDESFVEVIAARPIFDPGAELDIRGRLAEQIREAFESGVDDAVMLKQIAVRGVSAKPEDIG